MNRDPRPIHSDLKSHRIIPEPEKPSRWSFLKVLREYSTLKQFYPEINPYAEVYQFRENLYCIFTEGLCKMCGDMWCYLIDGPKKAMLIDTGMGAGNLKALCQKLVGDKEIVVVNTHMHLDHIGGNLWFDQVYCHEYDKEQIEKSITPTFIMDATTDTNGIPNETYYDVNDLPPFHTYEVIGVESGHIFDLGDGYEVELFHLPGHTPGQSAFYDRQTKCLFIGDTTSAFGAAEGEKHPECCTILALRNALVHILNTIGEDISGVFPGHGTIDLHPISLQYLLDTANRILEHPDWYDDKVMFGETEMYAKMVYQQGSDLKYTMKGVR
ncbi:MAG: MBL fold metallo-hydrolase [Erysipelotrichaceae bacterium]|nr:MBL fold metallo-hydrolase [Erysipelotrichaceae bacterium]